MPHAADALIALGGALLVCGLLARGGVRLGLPTVPLFMLAGVVFGPSTGGTLYQTTEDALLSPVAIAPSGGGQPHNNMQPYLTFNFNIALQGEFPVR